MYDPKYIDSNYKGPMLIRSYLQKLKSENAKSRFIRKFNKRFFILDLSNYFFAYKDKENSSKISTYPLTDLINVDPNPRIIEICEWKFAFVIQLGNRIYHLYADSVSIHNEWCNALKACLKPLERLIYQESPNASKPSPAYNSPMHAVDPVLKPSLNPNPPKDLPNIGLPHVITSNPTEPEMRYKPEEIIKMDLKQPENPRKIDANVENQNNQENNLRKRNSVEFNYGKSHQSSLYGLEPEIPAFGRSQSEVENSKNLSNPPMLNVIKSNFRPDPIPNKSKNQDIEDEDEVTFISGPVNLKKEIDQISQVIPVIYSKERPISKTNLTSPKKENFTSVEIPPVSQNVFVKQVPDFKVEFKSGGMFDIMNEFNNLGLEQVKVRPILEVKKKIIEDKTKKEEVKFENVQKNPEVKNLPKTEKKEFFEPEKKTGLGKVTLKAGINKVPDKVGYVEKPEISPDDSEIVQKSGSIQNRKSVDVRPTPKQKAEFVEKNEKMKPQGDDCDWDEWDN